MLECSGNPGGSLRKGAAGRVSIVLGDLLPMFMPVRSISFSFVLSLEVVFRLPQASIKVFTQDTPLQIAEGPGFDHQPIHFLSPSTLAPCRSDPGEEVTILLVLCHPTYPSSLQRLDASILQVTSRQLVQDRCRNSTRQMTASVIV